MDNCETPNLLLTLLKWVLLGPYDRYEERKRVSKIDISTCIITQLVVQFVKTQNKLIINLITKVPLHTIPFKHY